MKQSVPPPVQWQRPRDWHSTDLTTCQAAFLTHMKNHMGVGMAPRGPSCWRLRLFRHGAQRHRACSLKEPRISLEIVIPIPARRSVKRSYLTTKSNLCPVVRVRMSDNNWILCSTPCQGSSYQVTAAKIFKDTVPTSVNHVGDHSCFLDLMRAMKLVVHAFFKPNFRPSLAIMRCSKLNLSLRCRRLLVKNKYHAQLVQKVVSTQV